MPRKKCLIFDKFYLTSRIFFVSVLLSALVERCFVSSMREFLSVVLHLRDMYTVFCPFLSVSVRVGIGAPNRSRRKIQGVPYTGFFSLFGDLLGGSFHETIFISIRKRNI